MRNLLLWLLALTTLGRADSPLTSTDFHTAYGDIKLVAAAAKSHKLDRAMADFLASSKTPIDQKAALINALGWNLNGQSNAARFRELARKPADEAFCLGYLTAMDDYNHPEKAMAQLDRAARERPTSYTVAMIGALVRSQQYIGSDPDTNKWKNVWPQIEAVLKNKKLKADMRPQAVQVILAYMKGYEEYR